ncbi:MAG: hypothetical protein FD171_1554 [Actinobacteria bacterium]|nr:MAG: hypothetical protein FD171_1554 [Actinomycetota bacterium]
MVNFSVIEVVNFSMDKHTGEMTGLGPSVDGWLTAEDAANCRGEHWGITSTQLLRDRRFDERLPGYEDTLWAKINVDARRYYLNRALRIYHTEGVNRVTESLGNRGIKEKVRVFAALGEDREYLMLLKSGNPRVYRRLMNRIRAARLLRLFVRSTD